MKSKYIELVAITVGASLFAAGAIGSEHFGEKADQAAETGDVREEEINRWRDAGASLVLGVGTFTFMLGVGAKIQKSIKQMDEDLPLRFNDDGTKTVNEISLTKDDYSIQ